NYNSRCIGGGMREGGARFFMAGFTMDDDAVIFLGDGFTAVPHFFYKGAGGIVFLHLYADAAQLRFQSKGGSKSRYQHYIIGLQAVDRNQFPAISVLQKLYATREEVGVYMRIVDHFTQQKNPPSRIFFN